MFTLWFKTKFYLPYIQSAWQFPCRMLCRSRAWCRGFWSGGRPAGSSRSPTPARSLEKMCQESKQVNSLETIQETRNVFKAHVRHNYLFALWKKKCQESKQVNSLETIQETRNVFKAHVRHNYLYAHRENIGKMENELQKSIIKVWAILTKGRAGFRGHVVRLEGNVVQLGLGVHALSRAKKNIILHLKLLKNKWCLNQ